MIEGGSSGPEVLTQIEAARAALRALENCLIEQNLRACLTDASAASREQDAGSTKRRLLRMVALIRRT